ncbi:endo-1,4-beta-xylanase [Neorhodopirellula pilleata]|uniref:endo-1,4-beta-xylanase n=1 Tax=Neorhodopirellula pilleata TaxID=2714738 RepID=A0A5C6AW94_9BACT|nr:endo-1,4-beta-xylanase [Neorhodopirellula pilleata]TWU03346.1 Endo-1,4-beta-xylanase/feruloyl esterase precursor [Neorhodopirellula pilleata]
MESSPHHVHRIMLISALSLMFLISSAFLFVPTLCAEKTAASRGTGGKKGFKISKVEPPTLSPPNGPRLREIAPLGGSCPLVIGGSTSIQLLGTEAETIINREFQFITPANAFKQAGVHPEPGVWKWEKPDAWIERCRERGEIMRLHACVSPQCSAWAEEDHRTPEELRQNMEEYVEGICKRYGHYEHVKWIDVVNETITREGEWFGPREGVGKWQNPWTQIGFDETHPLRPPLYIKRAFEIADEHAPNVKLLYNQHGDMESAAWKKLCATVLYLREKNVRIDGIGWQAHVNSGFEQDAGNMDRLNKLIAWAHAHDLEFHVTENTVWTKDGDDEAQAATFAAIIRTLLSHSKNGIVTWNAWQMRDSDTQRPERKGNLFDTDGNPRPSYYAVQAELMKFQ